MSKQDTNEGIFELLLFLLTSARVAVDEPKRYGSFRLFQAYKRMLALAPRLDASRGKVYERILGDLERKKDVAASSSSVGTEEYGDLLDELIETMANEV